jgi:hypothetical protein
MRCRLRIRGNENALNDLTLTVHPSLSFLAVPVLQQNLIVRPTEGYNKAGAESLKIDFGLSLSPTWLTLQMEGTCSSETSVDFHRTTRRYIPEDRTLHSLYRSLISVMLFVAV